jgi:hypothetical protein
MKRPETYALHNSRSERSFALPARRIRSREINNDKRYFTQRSNVFTVPSAKKGVMSRLSTSHAGLRWCPLGPDPAFR